MERRISCDGFFQNYSIGEEAETIPLYAWQSWHVFVNKVAEGNWQKQGKHNVSSTEIYRADCFDENISKRIWCFNGI